MPMTHIDFIDKAAEKIKWQINSGEIVEACGMTAAATPVTESWEIAQELAENNSLTHEQQHSILNALEPAIQQQLKAMSFDDFDLIYGRLLQLVLTS